MSHIDNPHANQLVSDTLVILLAGGQGSRLHELTASRAKPDLEFGGACRIIDFPLSNCVNSGLKRIGVVTQYKAQSLIRHMMSTWAKFNRNFGEFIELLPASQQHTQRWYQGTADSLFQNIDFIKAEMPKYVLVLSGDHVYKMDYRSILEKHVSSGAQITISCIEAPLQQAAGQFGVVNVDADDCVVSFEEKPLHPKGLPDKPEHVLASMGNYVFNTDFLIEQLQKDAGDHNSGHDFGKDIIPKIVDSQKVQAFRFRSHDTNKPPYWRDVGTLDAYWESNMAMLNSQITIDIHDNTWRIWGASIGIKPTRFVKSDAQVNMLLSNSIVSAGCTIHPSRIKNSVIFDDSLIQQNAQVYDSVLLPKVSVGENVTIKKAIIDRGCIIPDNLAIGENVEDDIKHGFRISKDGVVLVSQEMLRRLPVKKYQYLPEHAANGTDLLTRHNYPVRLSLVSKQHESRRH